MKKLLFVVVCGAALASCSDDTNLRDKYGKHTKRGLALAGPDSSRNAGAKKSAANQSDEKEKEERGGRDGQNDSAVGTDNGGDRGQDELCPLLVYDTQFPNLPPFDPCPKVFVNINGNKRLNTDDAFALMVTDTINRLSGTQYLNPSTNVTGPVYTNGPHGFECAP